LLTIDLLGPQQQPAAEKSKKMLSLLLIVWILCAASQLASAVSLSCFLMTRHIYYKTAVTALVKNFIFFIEKSMTRSKSFFDFFDEHTQLTKTHHRSLETRNSRKTKNKIAHQTKLYKFSSSKIKLEMIFDEKKTAQTLLRTTIFSAAVCCCCSLCCCVCVCCLLLCACVCSFKTETTSYVF